MRKVKYGDDYYYEHHEDKSTPEEIKDKLLKKEVVRSFYAKPYHYFKIIKE